MTSESGLPSKQKWSFKLLSTFKSQPTISDQQLKQGLRMLTGEGVASMAMFSVTTSGVLAAYALALGANNFQIGMMASISAIMQPLQIPAIFLVEKFRQRKAIALLSWLPAQLLWIPMALIPIFIDVPGGAAISALLFLLGLRAALGAVTNCAWNSWMKDLVPQEIMGRFYSRRMALATTGAIIFGVGGALFVDYWRGNSSPDNQVFGYTLVLLFGAIFLGFGSPLFMSRIPEPSMQPLMGRIPSLKQMLSKPFRDKNFRQLMNFLFFWSFAANLAIPFFTILMLQRLGFPLLGVIALTTLSQLTNIMFLSVWGPFADRFGSKVILSTGVSLYLLVIIGWSFTTMPERYFLTIPLVIVLQVFAGIAAAAVNLTVGTIGLKLAPQGEATSYMAAASLTTNLGAGLGPLVGGRFVDFFSLRELTVNFGWSSPTNVFQFDAISLTGHDFLFAISFIIGLITLNTLTTIREEGEVGREVLLNELVAPTRGMTRALGSIPGMQMLGEFPYAYLRRIPGMDVALGVTAYQLASSTRTAVTAASRGREAVEDTAERVRDALSTAIAPARDVGEHGTELALHAARGAMNAAGELTVDAGQLAKGAVIGTLRALRRTAVDPLDALRGAVYGAVEGADQAHVDMAEAAVQAVEGAKEAAREFGMSPEEAATQAAQSALKAAEAIGPEAVTRIREALHDEPSNRKDS